MGLLFKKATKVIEVNNPFFDYYILKVEIPEGFHWKPGQFTLLSFKGKFKGRHWHAFSIASMMEEGYILFGTRTGEHPSGFKEYLKNLKANDFVYLRGPIGGFGFCNRNKPIVLFAGGIGITPIFSLLKSNCKVDVETHIVYASSKAYLFKDEIDQLVHRNPFLRITYTRSTEETQNVLSKLIIKYGNDASYFTAGSYRAIKGTKQFLRDHKIKRRNMFSNRFFGYN
jgi:predicted ferric reductase